MNQQNNKKIEIYTISTCPYCVRAKQLLDNKNVKYIEINLDADPSRSEMVERTGGPRSVPQIFIDNEFLAGGCDGLYEREASGELDKLLN